MQPSQTWQPPPLSTDCTAAEAHYRRGIAALVAGVAGAEASLAEAVTIDPSFFLARVGIATANALAGQPYRPPPIAADVLRGERQHAEIIQAAFGHHRRADHLRREHLLEYPGDILIVWLPVLLSPPASGAGRIVPRSLPNPVPGRRAHRTGTDVPPDPLLTAADRLVEQTKTTAVAPTVEDGLLTGLVQHVLQDAPVREAPATTAPIPGAVERRESAGPGDAPDR